MVWIGVINVGRAEINNLCSFVSLNSWVEGSLQQLQVKLMETCPESPWWIDEQGFSAVRAPLH